MNVAAFVEALQRDIEAVAGMGDEAVAEAARRIAAALEPSLRLRLMDVLGEAAVELTSQLPNGHVEVRVAGGDPELVFVEERAGPHPVSASSPTSATPTPGSTWSDARANLGNAGTRPPRPRDPVRSGRDRYRRGGDDARVARGQRLDDTGACRKRTPRAPRARQRSRGDRRGSPARLLHLVRPWPRHPATGH